MNRQNRQRLLSGALALGALLPTLSAQEIGTLRLFGPVALRKPHLVDSTDVQQKKYAEARLLEHPQSLQLDRLPLQQLVADSASRFQWSHAAAGYQLFEAHFNVDVTRYTTGTIELESADLFQLHQNGKLIGSKTEFQDSLSATSKSTQKVTLEPRSHRFVVRYLAKPERTAAQLSLRLRLDDSTAVATLHSDKVRRLYLNELMEGERITNVSLSPSGNYLASSFSLTTPEGKVSSWMEVSEVATGRILLQESGARQSAQWMPKSDRLYFAASGAKGRELRSIDPATGREAQLATGLPEGSIEMSPDEKSLFLQLREELPQDKGAMKRLLSPDDRQGSYRTRYQIGRFDLQQGVFEQLTFGHTTAAINDISEDGTRLLFSTRRQELSERPFSLASLFEMNLQTGAVDTLWVEQRYGGSASYSPDGKQLVVTASVDAFEGVGNPLNDSLIANSYDMQLFRFDLSTRKATPLTRNFNPAIQSSHWNRADNLIYTLCEDRDRVALYSIHPTTGEARLLPLDEEVVRGFSLSANGKQLAYIGQSASNFTNGYLFDLRKAKSTKLYDGTTERLDQVELGSVKPWNFTTADGTLIEGRYHLPPNFDPTKRYPMIVYYYGGTAPTSRTMEHPYPMHLYAAQGYVVYTLNPSGTTGFGSEFAARHVNAWGKRTADEIIEGTRRFCAEHSFVDSTKIGNIGASYGGFMTMYLHTQTNLFATGISHAGISDITSYWGEGFWGYSYSSAASANSFPWNNRDLFVGQSPLFHADKVTNPLLLLHGTVDTNVPIGESIQMYNALKLLGKPVEFVRIEGEDHGIRDYQKRIEWTKTILAWFDRHLKGEGAWWEAIYPKSSIE